MLPSLVYDNFSKWFLWGSIAVLFAIIGLFAITGDYFVFAGAFAYVFVILLGINWKTAYWILLFCIPASVQIGFAGGSLSACLPDEPMMWLFLLLFVFVWAKDPSIIPQWWWRNPLVLVVVLQFLWLIVAVIFSLEFFFSVKFLIAKLWFLVCFFILPLWVFTGKKDYKRGLILMLIPILITSIIILARQSIHNFDFRDVENAIRINYNFGLYYNHVDYSTVLSMFLPLLCVAYPLTKGKSILLRGLLLLIILFFLPAIYLTYARAAMIALFFALFIYFAIKLKLVNYVMPVFYGIFIILVVYMIRDNKYIDFRPDYQHTYMHKNFLDHMIATFKGQDMSSMERVYRWVAGARMSVDRPITGYGPHSFYYYYKPYAVSSFRTYVSRNLEHSTTHNYFLLMLVEQGWPAMILYAILVVVFFAMAQKTYHRFKDKYYKQCTMGVTLMFAAGFINNFFSELLETHKVGSLFYLALALLVILDKKSKDLEKEQMQAI
jgi:O-antigen ligase